MIDIPGCSERTNFKSVTVMMYSSIVIQPCVVNLVTFLLFFSNASVGFSEVVVVRYCSELQFQVASSF